MAAQQRTAPSPTESNPAVTRQVQRSWLPTDPLRTPPPARHHCQRPTSHPTPGTPQGSTPQVATVHHTPHTERKPTKNLPTLPHRTGHPHAKPQPPLTQTASSARWMPRPANGCTLKRRRPTYTQKRKRGVRHKATRRPEDRTDHCTTTPWGCTVLNDCQ